MNKLDKKVAIISGAGSGIGWATAELFAENGARLILTDINGEALETAKQELGKKGAEVFTLVADTSKPEDNKKAVDLAIEKFGSLDIAFNNAGIGGSLTAVGDYPLEDWDKVIGVNLSGVFYGMHYQIPAMLETGKNPSIINTASVAGAVAIYGAAGYIAAKHGVVGLTKSAALDYGAQGLRVNAVAPGYISTPLLDGLDSETHKGLVGLHPIGRLGEAEEVAKLVLWLASDDSSFTTGGYYPIDGGYLAQ